MKTFYLTALFTLVTLTANPPFAAAAPAGDHAWCGSHPAKLAAAVARHEAFQRSLERRRQAGALPLKSAPTVFWDGDIVIMEDDGSLVAPPNPFDLQGRGMQFLRRPKGMSVVRTHLGFKQLIGDKLDLGDEDSKRIDFPADFRFPFGDRIYTSVWVNSNGNLTFGIPESDDETDSLEALLDGPPRIAPLFSDLDPSAATGDNGVYVNFLTGRVRVTWLGVPEFGSSNMNTVQVTLFDTGRVTFVYGDEVETSSAVVGVSAFSNGELRVIDYDEELPFRPPQRVAVAEEFLDSQSRDDVAITRAFFEHFRDLYDHVIVWLDFPEVLRGGAFAFEFNVKNSIEGIGLGSFDFTDLLGIDARRLESFVQMGTLERYPDDPDTVVLGNTFSTMSVLGHEVGHRWLSFVRFIDREGNRSDAILGRDLQHWSYFMDSEGSVMEGNDWTEAAGGGFVTTDRATTRFSELDQYLMGLLGPEGVPDFFYIANPTSGGNPAAPPVAGGVTEDGQRVDVSVRDVIAAEGPRVPASADAPKSFRTAFILVARDGEPVSRESIDKLERIRERWVDWFQDATDNRGQVSTRVFPR